MKPLDLRLNWVDSAKVLAAVLQDGSLEGRTSAREELLKMALAAQLGAEACTALKDLVRLKAIKQRIDSRAASPDERADYKRSKNAAWARAKAVAGRAL